MSEKRPIAKDVYPVMIIREADDLTIYLLSQEQFERLDGNDPLQSIIRESVDIVYVNTIQELINQIQAGEIKIMGEYCGVGY